MPAAAVPSDFAPVTASGSYARWERAMAPVRAHTPYYSSFTYLVGVLRLEQAPNQSYGLTRL